MASRTTWRFDNLKAFADACKGVPRKRKDDDERSWAGETTPESIAFCTNGDTRHVASAELLLSQMDTDLNIKSRQWVSEVCGAFPSVPDYLSGNPESMRTRHRCEFSPA